LQTEVIQQFCFLLAVVSADLTLWESRTRIERGTRIKRCHRQTRILVKHLTKHLFVVGNFLTTKYGLLIAVLRLLCYNSVTVIPKYIRCIKTFFNGIRSIKTKKGHTLLPLLYIFYMPYTSFFLLYCNFQEPCEFQNRGILDLNIRMTCY